MHRRLFGASVLAVAIESLMPEDDRELVIDYAGKTAQQRATLGRTVAYSGQNPDKHNHEFLDVKQGWLLPDGTLRLERYRHTVQKTDGRDWLVMSRRLDGEYETYVTDLTDWTLIRYDGRGVEVSRRNSTS